MAENRPSGNHLITTGLVEQHNVTNATVFSDGRCVYQQYRPKSSMLNQRAEPSKSNFSTSKIKSAEFDSKSSNVSALLPDVRHINGFYTIADTLHKENANSAVTVTTQSQMGDVRMSSRVAEPLSYKHSHIHTEWDRKTFINNDLQIQVHPNQVIENSAFTSPLKELTDCVEHISLLEDDEFNSRPKVDVSAGSLECQPISQFGNVSIDTDNLLPSSHDNKQQTTDHSMGKEGPLTDQSMGQEGPLDIDRRSEQIPTNISEFVLGHERGKSQLAVQVPLDDSDLDRILPNGFDKAVELVRYESELQMPDIMRLITKDLSEPYSIYTYRYFIHNWPSLCFLAMHGPLCVGAIVCKLDVHKKVVRRGYIAMLAVDENYRKQKIGSSLVRKAIRAMIRGECDEVVLETEITNKPALRLYENLGFSRDKRLFRYYLNGVDALRLKLWLR